MGFGLVFFFLIANVGLYWVLFGWFLLVFLLFLLVFCCFFFYSMFLRSCWLLQNCFNKNKIGIQCLITSGSSPLPEFCMDPACLTWQLIQVSLFLLLPKIAHLVILPVMCELCKKTTKILLVNNFTISFLNYLCKIFALFSTWNKFLQPLSLGVQFTFCKENAVTVMNFENCFQCLQLPKFFWLVGKELSTDKERNALF